MLAVVLRALICVVLTAAVLIAAATIAIVFLMRRAGTDKGWLWRMFELSLFAVVTLTVWAGAVVLLSALWKSDTQETALIYTTPAPRFAAPATAVPTERVAVAPTEIAEPQPHSSPSLTVIDKMCSFQDTIRALSDCTVRSYPSKTAPKLADLDKGACLNRLGFNPDGWSKVSYNGIVGYSITGYLESVDRNENEVVDYDDTVYVVEAGSLYAEPDGDSDKLLYASKRMTLTRTGITCDGWSRVSYEGNDYYMRTDKLLGS